MNEIDYIKLSLELHLFFDRIMKEHSFFLETGFLEKNKEYKQIAREFQKRFSKILMEVVELADGNISNDFLESDEIITKDTLKAEKKTSELSGIDIDTNITLKEAKLKNGDIVLNRELVNKVTYLNKKTIPLLKGLIHFKEDVLKEVLECKLYSVNYPLLITHIINEAKMYYKLLIRLENNEPFDEEYIYEQELFWDTIMKEHAEFIRGLIDPSEEELIDIADGFSKEYKNILENYISNPNLFFTRSLNETINFRDFKVTGEEGILNCQIKSIIIPLLADHILREANHFIRILESIKNN